MDETMARLRTVFRTTNALTLPVSGTGSAGMEACFVNLSNRATPRSSASTACSASACARWRAAAAPTSSASTRRGARRSTRSGCSTRSAAHPDARVARGRARRDVDRRRERRSRRCARCSGTDTLLLVDTVTSLGGIPVEVDGWGVDACYSGTQKCLGVPPGLSPVTFSPRAVERVQTRATPPQSWYLDLGAASRTTSAARSACTTTPRRSRWCSRCTRALGALLDEGLEAAWARHRAVGARLQARAARARVLARRARGPPAARSSRPRGCPTAPTTPKLRAGAARHLRHRGRRRARRVRGQGVAHRAHGPLGARALGHDAARRAARTARLT